MNQTKLQKALKSLNVPQTKDEQDDIEQVLCFDMFSELAPTPTGILEGGFETRKVYSPYVLTGHRTERHKQTAINRIVLVQFDLDRDDENEPLLLQNNVKLNQNRGRLYDPRKEQGHVFKEMIRAFGDYSLPSSVSQQHYTRF